MSRSRNATVHLESGPCLHDHQLSISRQIYMSVILTSCGKSNCQCHILGRSYQIDLENICLQEEFRCKKKSASLLLTETTSQLLGIMTSSSLPSRPSVPVARSPSGAAV